MAPLTALTAELASKFIVVFAPERSEVMLRLVVVAAIEIEHRIHHKHISAQHA
jgi:hypothetical protein